MQCAIVTVPFAARILWLSTKVYPEVRWFLTLCNNIFLPFGDDVSQWFGHLSLISTAALHGNIKVKYLGQTGKTLLVPPLYFFRNIFWNMSDVFSIKLYQPCHTTGSSSYLCWAQRHHWSSEKMNVEAPQWHAYWTHSFHGRETILLAAENVRSLLWNFLPGIQSQQQMNWHALWEMYDKWVISAPLAATIVSKTLLLPHINLWQSHLNCFESTTHFSFSGS